jgi:hypothetical protein
MDISERFSPATPDCRTRQLDSAGHCLRASFSCPDHGCPEISGLLMRLFASPGSGPAVSPAAIG